MTAENLDSNALVNLDAQPIVMPTAGEGGYGYRQNQQDYVTHTTSFGSAAGNSSRQSRFPVAAKVKSVWMYTYGLDSSSAQTMTLDVNVAFSDSAFDGTNAQAQAQIPLVALTGGLVSLATYTGANKLFGSALTVAASGAVQYEEVTWKGASEIYNPALAQEPMWAVLGGTGTATAAPFNAGGGFAQNANGVITSPGGFFDLLVVTAHTSTVDATGTIGTEVDFVL
jgi:hypothetical protein